MHALIVIAHPDEKSLTHTIAAKIAEGIKMSEVQHSFEIADLASENFDPRFTKNDLSVLRKTSQPTEDVLLEHERINRADALILVYPIYWWSFPALLKGWIDRVFTQGWAYEDDENGKIVKKLKHLKIHLIAIGGADQRTYARYGYFGAMKTQIDHGIFGYCGAEVKTSELFLPSDKDYPCAHLKKAKIVGNSIFSD